jgi:hypothetical protein
MMPPNESFLKEQCISTLNLYLVTRYAYLLRCRKIIAIMKTLSSVFHELRNAFVSDAEVKMKFQIFDIPNLTQDAVISISAILMPSTAVN